MQAPEGLCPFCGFGQATTLDHYLPKAKFPQLSVLPSNLVPSCKDCNTSKSARIVTTKQKQCLHPYFDHHNFIDQQWLHGEVRHTKPATIRFFVKVPGHWDDISKARVQSHFKDFNLSSRYSLEASHRLAFLGDLFANLVWLDSVAVRQQLTGAAESGARQHVNSWETAMFQALAESDWYCDGGFT